MTSATDPAGQSPDASERPQRRLRAFWAGRGAFALGSVLSTLAVPFYLTIALKLDPFLVAVVMAAPFVATVFSPLYAGVLADLMDRRRVLILSDLISSVLVSLFGVAAFVGYREIWFWALLNLLFSAVNSISMAASRASFPDIVGEDRLDSGYGKLQTISTVADTAGGLLGGSIIAFLGAGVAFMINAGSLFLSAMGYVFTRWDSKIEGAAQSESYWSRVSRGFKVIWSNRLVRSLVLTSTFSNFFMSIAVIALLWFLVRDLGLPYIGYIVVLAVGSAGALLGAILTERITRLLGSPLRAQAASLAVEGMMLCLYASLQYSGFSSIVIAAVLDFMIGVSLSLYVVNNSSSLQRNIARENRGSTSSVRSFSSALAGVAGTFVSGVLITLFDSRTTVLVCGLGAILVALTFILGPVRRDLTSAK